MSNIDDVVKSLDCGVRLKDFFTDYLTDLNDKDPEKFKIVVGDLMETTKPINIETAEELDTYLMKIHHPIVENKGLWDVSDTSKIANSIGIDFNETWYNEYSFNYVMNMARADNYEAMIKFCDEYPVVKQYIVDNPKFYAYLSKAWLEDEDAPKMKLMLYLENIVDYA
jgi:hypothetical protein